MDAGIPEDLCHERLSSVDELIFDPTDEPGLPTRVAIVLRFGTRSLVVKALTDTSELDISLKALAPDEPGYQLRDASKDDAFQSFIGKPLRNWWIARNDKGYTDAFLVAFEEARGLCFVAMNDAVSILGVGGEQWS